MLFRRSFTDGMWGNLMLRVLGQIECLGATASADPWIPLTVTWQVGLRGGPLYLYVTGQEGGYVELKIDPDSGGLYALVIVDLPPQIERNVGHARVETGLNTPVFDLGLWEWKVTPDYKEPVKHDIDVTSALGYSTPDDSFALWFSYSEVSHYLATGDVRVGVSLDGGLVTIVVPRPPVVEPQLSRGGSTVVAQ